VNGTLLGAYGPTAINYYEGKKSVITVGPIVQVDVWTNTEGF